MPYARGRAHQFLARSGGRTDVHSQRARREGARRQALVVPAARAAVRRAPVSAAVRQEDARAARVPVLLLVPVRVGDRRGGDHDPRVPRAEGRPMMFAAQIKEAHHTDATALTIFIVLFVLVTVLGFVA